MVERRKPRGYVGTDHVTLGSDILSVLAVLKLPEQVLGKEDAARLGAVKPTAFYPVAWLLDLMETLDRDVGQYALLRMGRNLFKRSHQKRVLEAARSAKDIVHGIDGMYHFGNRGTAIGGWRVLKFEPGLAELEKTTPHHCMMEQGILTEALSVVGCPSNVEQRQCFRKGADSCVYVVSSTFTDEKWSGVPA
jgi:hypothetical protein